MCPLIHLSFLHQKFQTIFLFFYFLPSKSTTEKPKSFTSCDFSLENMSKFENSISTIKWNFVRDEPDAQSAFNAFFNIFHNLYSLQFPLRTVKFNQNIHCLEPWMSPALLISHINKIKLASLSARSPCV